MIDILNELDSITKSIEAPYEKSTTESSYSNRIVEANDQIDERMAPYIQSLKSRRKVTRYVVKPDSGNV